MATWTTPATVSAGNTLPAAFWDQQVRDNMLVLSTHAHTGAAGDGAAILIPVFANENRISWLLPVPAQAGGSGTTGDLVAVDNLQGNMGEGWDSTNFFVYTNFQTTRAGGGTAYARIKSRMSCAVDTLPVFSFGMAHISLVTNTLRAGLGDQDFDADPNNGLYFRNINGANWFAIARNAGAETAQDTGIAASTTAKAFQITVETTGVIRYYIGGTLVSTITSANIPAVGTLLQARIAMITASPTTGTFNAAFSQWMGLSYEVKSST